MSAHSLFEVPGCTFPGVNVNHRIRKIAEAKSGTGHRRGVAVYFDDGSKTGYRLRQSNLCFESLIGESKRHRDIQKCDYAKHEGTDNGDAVTSHKILRFC